MNLLKRSPNVVALAVVSFVTVLAHFILLIADGIYWDDWIYVKAMGDRRMDIVDVKFAESAVFNAPYFYRFLQKMPGPVFGSKLIALAFLLLIALCTYYVARSSKKLTYVESALLAIVGVTFPAYQTTPLLVTLIYLLGLAGWYLGFALLRASQLHAPLRIPLRLVALLLFFFISFPTNSFLVWNYVGMLTLLAFELDGRRPRFSDLRGFLVRNLDLALLPVAFWVYKERFYPRFGDYEDYNRIHPSPVTLVRHGIEFLSVSVFENLDLALAQVGQRPALVLGITALVVYLWFRKEREPALSPEGSWKSAHIAIFGLLLLGLAIFPYAVVDKGPHLHGKASRHALLIGVPMGILAVAALRRFGRAAGDALRPIGLCFASILVLGFVFCDIDNEIQWQARWVKDRAIIHTLSKMPEAKRYSVYWVDDPTIAPGYDHYSTHDWANIFHRAWGGESRIGMDLMNSAITQLHDPAMRSDHYNLGELDANGPQANLRIRMKTLPEGNTSWDYVYHYAAYKASRGPMLDKYLGRLVEIEVTPADGPPTPP